MSTAIEAIEAARAKLAAEGFLGVWLYLIGEGADADHVLRMSLYRFTDGSSRVYVEAVETHEGRAEARILPLSEVVHLLQNVGEMELYQIGNREPAAACPHGCTTAEEHASHQSHADRYLDVACSVCDAPAGEPCIGTAPHNARYHAQSEDAAELRKQLFGAERLLLNAHELLVDVLIGRCQARAELAALTSDVVVTAMWNTFVSVVRRCNERGVVEVDDVRDVLSAAVGSVAGACRVLPSQYGRAVPEASGPDHD